MERRTSGGTWFSIGGIGGAILLAAAMYGISRVDDIEMFYLAAVVLTLVMAGVVFFGGGKKSRPPLGSIIALIAMAAGTYILVADPFHSDDTAIYAVSFAILAAVVWESIDLLLLHNRECSNPLPQFDTHQGGEDNA